MTEILWEPEAEKNYKKLVGSKSPLSQVQKDLLNQRIDALRGWPPKKWFDLRNQEDGVITFQLDASQFAEILGVYQDGAVTIYFFNVKGGK